MFVTEPEFQQYMPAELLGAQQLWRAVTLLGMSHWFLFQYVAAEGTQVPETALLADEWSLLARLGEVSQACRRSLCRVQREKVSGRWTQKWVDALWMPAPIELESTGLLLFRFEGEADLRDMRLQLVPLHEGRTLLFQGLPEVVDAA